MVEAKSKAANRARRGMAVVAAVLSPLLGCESAECWNLELGVYSVKVHELEPAVRYYPLELPSCGASLAPVPGDVLRVRVVDREPNEKPEDCHRSFGQLEGGASLNFVDGAPLRDATVPVPTTFSRQVFDVKAAIDWNGCRGTWSVSATGLTSEFNPFVPYRPGDPAVVLYRVFFIEPDQADNPACKHCGDSFGVEVTR